jgi:hypothetical protein
MTTTSRHAIGVSVVSVTPPSVTVSIKTPDPLLTLLRRYEAELAAFDRDIGTEAITDQEWDKIAEDTWSRTQHEILEHQPPATTAVGAVSALDHVMQNEYLFGEREECAAQQMLWLLIKAARDYIVTAEAQK